jgi:hypothetical protein
MVRLPAPQGLRDSHTTWTSFWGADHEGIGYGELLDASQAPRPGIRSQIAVVDYDGDGKLDVLLGDFCTNLHLRKDLTPEQRREFKAAQDRQDKAGKKLRDQMDALQERWKTMMKDVPKSKWNTPENMAKWQKMYQEMRASPAYKRHNEEYERVQKELRQYVEPTGSKQGGPDVAHGYVWLFRRK